MFYTMQVSINYKNVVLPVVKWYGDGDIEASTRKLLNCVVIDHSKSLPTFRFTRGGNAIRQLDTENKDLVCYNEIELTHDLMVATNSEILLPPNTIHDAPFNRSNKKEYGFQNRRSTESKEFMKIVVPHKPHARINIELDLKSILNIFSDNEIEFLLSLRKRMGLETKVSKRRNNGNIYDTNKNMKQFLTFDVFVERISETELEIIDKNKKSFMKRIFIKFNEFQAQNNQTELVYSVPAGCIDWYKFVIFIKNKEFLTKA